jgi:hypothetical protein
MSPKPPEKAPRSVVRFPTIKTGLKAGGVTDNPGDDNGVASAAAGVLTPTDTLTGHFSGKRAH